MTQGAWIRALIGIHHTDERRDERIDWLRGFHKLPWRQEDRGQSNDLVHSDNQWRGSPEINEVVCVLEEPV